MTYQFGKRVVITLGGSIIYPETIDVAFLKKFKTGICPFFHTHQFVIVIGGGYIARYFQNAASRVASVSNEDKDWIGIHATRLNAHLLRTIFRDVADPVVFDEQGKFKKLNYPLTIASGWRPGWSTDYVAAAIAHDLGIKEFVVAGKPSHVYDKDPSAHKHSMPLDRLRWSRYRSMIPKTWIPGSHFPIDPIAAKLADQKKLKGIVVDGRDIQNFIKLLNGKEFRGTVVE